MNTPKRSAGDASRVPTRYLVRVEGDGGREYAVTPAGLLVGRATVACAPDVPLRSGGTASRRHARIFLDGSACWIEDLGSRNGTFVGGVRVDGRRLLAAGDLVRLGDQDLRVLVRSAGPGDDRTKLQALTDTDAPADVAPPAPVAYAGQPLTIGRDPTNALVLDDPNVSRFHAVIEPGPHGPGLRDLDSRNGTRLNGVALAVAPLEPGMEIGIGPFQLVFTGTDVRARNERGSVSVEALGVAVKARRRQLLAPTYLRIRPGELVAIIGENGAGKTTLLKALAGVGTPSAGVVLINGEPVSQRQTDVGYVPQDDTVHALLRVVEALRFGAELRLPDRTPAEIAQAVDSAIDQLQLGERRRSLIGREGETGGNRLSGGERKRVCVAMEMLSRPSVVFLDEPLAPVDPWFSKEMLNVFRALAESSCAVVMVTHRPDDLPHCDKVAVLARGGYLCYYGPPAGALAFFGVEHFEDIYGALRARTGEEWAAHPGGEVAALRATAISPPPAAGARPARRPVRSQWPQTKVLARRYALLIRRDRINLYILAACIAVIAFALQAFDRGVFTGDEGKAPTFLFILSYAMVALGLVLSFRELVKERVVFRRERAIGVEPRAYLASKLLVLGAIATIAAGALTVLAFALHPMHRSGFDYACALLVLVLTAFAGIGAGLAISSVVRREDQATTALLIPIVLLLLFGGAVLPLTGGVRLPAALMPDRWSFAALGRFSHLASIPAGQTDQYGPTFNTAAPLAILALIAFTAVMAVFVAWRLERTRA
jgi:ABC-type multidrug transport system ATPase subunit